MPRRKTKLAKMNFYISMKNTQENSRKWLEFLLTQDLPFIAQLASQVAQGKVGELCMCGCNGFAFEVNSNSSIPPLQKRGGLFYQLAFASNFPEEINMLLFTDNQGFLNWVDVTYGSSNIGPIPMGLVMGEKIGAWPGWN